MTKKYFFIMTSWTVYLLLLLFFAIFAIYNYSLLLGWIVGCVATFISYFSIKFTYLKFASKDGSNLQLITVLRYLINIICQAIILIIIILINKYYHGLAFIEREIQSMYTPINIFTYIGGLTATWIMLLIIWSLGKV